MRIGIDARLFGTKQGGLGRYLEQLIQGLETLNTDAKFYIFLRKANWNEYTPQNPNFTKVLADFPWYGWQEQILFPRILNKHRLDLVHFPHWNVPIFYQNNFILTIHDLILLHYPDRRASTIGTVNYALKYFAFKYVLKTAARRAKKILTVSEFSKNDIISNLNIAPEKIEVTYLAPQNFNAIEPAQKIDSRITKPFALYVGVAFPHKNLDLLLQAWQKFQLEERQKYQLVLVGKRNYFYDRLISKNKPDFENNIIFTDYVNDRTLAAIYKKASAFVYPSLYEGFGLPPLEALAMKVPVIASNASCLPEILGDAALYFDPLSELSLCEALKNVFKDENVRLKLAENGSEILKKFSWEKTAKKTFELYKNSV